MDNPLLIDQPELKIKYLEEAFKKSNQGIPFSIPLAPSRGTLEVLPLKSHPEKKGLSSVEGRARLLHDLANIELQAMELAFRTFVEFPEAPEEFRNELMALTLSESQHLQLCLSGLNDLGYQWGHWPVHLVLWNCVSKEDSLLDRILIVHRYLEGSGLDAQDTILRRLEGLADRITYSIVKQIHREEIDHVGFGSYWYKKLSQLNNKIYTSLTWENHLFSLKSRLPKRIEPLCYRWRLQAGFSIEEIESLEKLRQIKAASKI